MSSAPQSPSMAFLKQMQSIPLISIYLLTLTIAAEPITITATAESSDIHDLLPQYGIPKGILPNAVKSYSLSPDDGAFTVELTRPCYVHFDDQVVYYSKNIQGKLTYGSVSDVSGIQAKQFFLWVPVTGMDIDTGSGMIEFHVGILSKKLPADQFEDVPDCKNKACQEKAPLESI